MTSFKLQAVRQKHGEIERRSKAFLSEHQYLEGIDEWLQILLDCHAFAMDCRRHGRSGSRDYMEAYATVASVAFSYAESARTVLLRGFYGNAMANIRALVSANDLVVDLTITAESPAKWLQLRAFRPDDRNNEARLLRQYFWDSSVRKRVAESGETSLSENIYGVASEAVHSSPWASHLFSAEDLTKPGEFYMQYQPQYHPFRAMLFAFLLESTLPHLCGYFLETCDGLYGGKNRSLAPLLSRYLLRLELFESQSSKRRAVLDKYKEAENRVRAGEDFDAVFSGA